MPTTQIDLGAAATSRVSSRPALRIGRWGDTVTISYFVYIACVATLTHATPARILLLSIAPLAILTLALYETRNSRPWSRVLRDWLPFGLVLLGYWEAGWVGGGSPEALDNQMMVFDRAIFPLGFQQVVEIAGGFLPAVLEFTYLCLYIIPILCMGAIYFHKARSRADGFLLTMILGTLGAYTLLPFFPTDPPRLAFATEYMPHYTSALRSVNLWLLNHADNSTSVFPSGHVAVAFSSAFGLLRALPERRGLWLTAFGAATIVLIATVYCRYHYAADGIASVGICTLAWLASGMLLRNE